MVTALRELLQEGIERGVFPGAAAALLDSKGVRAQVVLGHRMLLPQRRPMEPDTLFDLASLTKPLVTAALTLLLVEEGRVELERPVSEYLPAFERKEVTVFHLLTHTSGLPAWLPLYRRLSVPEEVVPFLGRLEPVCAVGTRIVYSCLGYILLGELLQARTGQALDTLARERLFEPLGMRETGFCPSPTLRERCAATESYESAARRHAPHPPYERFEPVLCGEVHDENAHFLGGVAGNAGLFAPLGDLIRYARCLVQGGAPLFSETIYRALFTPVVEDGTTRRSLAWIVREDGVCTHTGFTGTAFWWDPKRQKAALLLTNRVHPDATREGIGEFRQRFAALAFSD
ncbi:MAG: esterase [Candidatus Poribacteria bacterium]|nr:MAG: esterase [Candidatus Poribacteria bacterium]